MTVNVVMNNDMCQVSVEGEMTIFAAQEIKAALEEPISKAGEIEFDLSNITEIDGAGLQIMLMAKIKCMERGTKLRFTGHSQPVLEVLDLTDLGSFFGDPLVIQA